MSDEFSTFVKVNLDTNDVQYGEEPYWVISFKSNDSTDDNKFSAKFIKFHSGILLLHGITSLIAPRQIIELLCGCFMPESNIDHALKESNRISSSAKVKSISLDLNGVPIFVSYYHHSPDVIFGEWLDALQGRSNS